ncbi:MAG: hypothetical protein DRQ51_10555 [Gammaproteobacteria bacterium]|nr:MAG: hypothetical protein DRQ51_10555 [Gammaproteobacteria bacterium]
MKKTSIIIVAIFGLLGVFVVGFLSDNNFKSQKTITKKSDTQIPQRIDLKSQVLPEKPHSSQNNPYNKNNQLSSFEQKQKDSSNDFIKEKNTSSTDKLDSSNSVIIPPPPGYPKLPSFDIGDNNINLLTDIDSLVSQANSLTNKMDDALGGLDLPQFEPNTRERMQVQEDEKDLTKQINKTKQQLKNIQTDR